MVNLMFGLFDMNMECQWGHHETFMRKIYAKWIAHNVTNQQINVYYMYICIYLLCVLCYAMAHVVFT